MLENKFVAQNKDKWQTLERLLAEPASNPNEVTDSFIQVSEDLSYARTYYPNRSVRIYLNDITQRIFHILYKSEKNSWVRFRNFWEFELPAMMYLARKELLVSCLVFIVSMGIGILSCRQDPTFVNLILGENYVETTLANIESGDPMAIYKQSKEVGMFLGITVNNVRVALFTFVLGIFLGLGTAGFLMFNGIMVGCFQYFFIQKGLFTISFFTIWLHGTLEISSIIIAGAAGFTLGKGLLFPATYSRFQSFQMGAKRGVWIMLGIIPVFVVAGFIEGFLTRYTQMPNLIKGAIILFSFLFIVFYFVVYPFVVSRRPKFKDYELSETPEALDLDTPNQFGLMTHGQLLSATLTFMVKYCLGSVLRTLIGVAVLVCVGFMVNNLLTHEYSDYSQMVMEYAVMDRFLNLNIYTVSVILLLAVGSAVVNWKIFKTYQSMEQHTDVALKNYLMPLLFSVINAFVLFSLLAGFHYFFMFFFILFIYFINLCSVQMYVEKKGAVSAIIQTYQTISTSCKMFYMQSLTAILLVVGCIILYNSPVLSILVQSFHNYLIIDSDFIHFLLDFFFLGSVIAFVFVVMGFSFISSLYLYKNLKEIDEGTLLKKRIAEIKLKR